MELQSYFAKTDQGPFLNINEDDVSVDVANKIFMLFDGFGGSGIGDLAVKGTIETLKKFYTQFASDQEATLPHYFSQKYLIEGNGVINALRIAHTELLKKNSEKNMNERAGISAMCGVLSENILEIVSCGNIMAYLIRNGALSRLVIPHSYEHLGADYFERHFLTAPTSALGLFEDLHLVTAEVRVNEGDQIVFLSDGIYSRLQDEEIRYIISRADLDQFHKVDELIRMSNHRGNFDNQSALLLAF